MNHTNVFNYPPHIEELFKFDEYDFNPDPLTISATSLLRPVQDTVLCERNRDEIAMDVSDLISVWIGTAVHAYAEKIIKNSDKIFPQLQEKRLEIKFGKFTVTGKIDLILNGFVRDYKTASVWSYLNASNEADYCRQLSIYAYLAHSNLSGIRVDRGYIDMFLIDWRRGESQRSGDTYPPSKYIEKAVQLMPEFETEEYIRSRLSALENARNAENLPTCSPDELWQRPDVWAIKRNGRKSAVKLCNSKSEADEYLLCGDKAKPGDYIEYRRGKAVRCEYCKARRFCSQYLELKERDLV